MGDTERTVEREAMPQLPTSGQALGALAKSLGVNVPVLSSKTIRRYSSGRLEDRVKESTRREIIDAISDALAELGLDMSPKSVDESAAEAPTWADILDGHAINWDQMRAFLLPRMMLLLPRHHAAIWQTYVRLVAIDLALRAAALMHFTATPPTELEFLEWIGVNSRGSYLNKKRRESGLSLYEFTKSVGVWESAVEAWLYKGARPNDQNLAKIARALAAGSNPSEEARILRELRRFYLTRDIAVLLEEFIGSEAMGDIVERLRRYAARAYHIINDEATTGIRPDELLDLATFGSGSTYSKPLLSELVLLESDDDWKEGLLAVGSDWAGRVLEVNLEIHQAEEDALIRETDGRILENWDVSNPSAYAHYQRSMELGLQGRVHEALAEVAKAVELDPLDPANHFTMGSAKGGIGASYGDETLVKEGMDACWTAVALDPNWILPWTEIGWLLLQTGRAREAVEHLKGVRSGCGPLDSRYYDALGLALRELGELTEALAAFESSLELNPDDPRIASVAAATAWQVGDSIKFNRYRKMARHIGIADRWDRLLDLMKTEKSASSLLGIRKNPDDGVAALDAVIASKPTDPKPYLERARDYFVEGDNRKAISDLDKAISLDLGNAAGYLFRGVVYMYMNRYDRVIADMSRSIRLNPDEAMAYYYRGMAYGELDAFDLALADLDETIRLNPDHGDAYRVRGDCHRYRQEYVLAIADYDTALRLDHEDASSYRGRGAAYRMKQEFDLAIADYDSAVRFNPKDPFAHRFRGDAYLAKGEYERSVADFDAALKIDPADEVAYRSRGNARLFGGEFDLAMGDFNAALGCDPDSAPAYYARGVLHEVLGNTQEAENDRRRALELGYDE